MCSEFSYLLKSEKRGNEGKNSSPRRDKSWTEFVQRFTNVQLNVAWIRTIKRNDRSIRVE